MRVAIGLDHLPLIAIAETAIGARLRFAAGRHPGLQIAFVTFGPDTELDPLARLAPRRDQDRVGSFVPSPRS